MNLVRIYVENPSSFYYPGQKVTGRVELLGEIERKGILLLRFKGRTQTYWRDEEEGEEKAECCAEEVYFNVTQTLYQSGNNLFSSTTAFPFSFVFPPSLPSSFEHEYGNIRYYIQIIYSRPRKPNHEDTITLNVLSMIDLNTMLHLRHQFEVTQTKKIKKFGYVPAGKISAKVSLPSKGFTPGQTMSIGANIYNSSKIEVLKVHFNLQKKMKFKSRCKSDEKEKREKDEETILTGLISEGVKPKFDKCWTSGFTIPTNVQPSYSGELITIEYKLQVVLELSTKKSEHFILDLPFIIGTIPIYGVDSNFNTVPPPYKLTNV